MFAKKLIRCKFSCGKIRIIIGITHFYDFVINKKIWHHFFEEHGAGPNKPTGSLKAQFYSVYLQESCAVRNNLPRISRKCVSVDVTHYMKFCLTNQSHLQLYHCWW